MLLLSVSEYLLMLHLFGLYESLLLFQIYIYIEPFYRGYFRKKSMDKSIHPRMLLVKVAKQRY